MCIYAFLNLKLSTCRGILRLRARCKAVWFWVSAAHLPRRIVGRKENKKPQPPQVTSPQCFQRREALGEFPLACTFQPFFETGGGICDKKTHFLSHIPTHIPKSVNKFRDYKSPGCLLK